MAMQQRIDYGANADSWFESLSDDMAPLAAELRRLILRAVPSVTEIIKWGAPVYEKDGMSICGLRAAKGYVSLQFGSIGITLDDPDKLLEGTDKRMRHVKVRTKGEIKGELFTSWIKEAVKV